MEDHEKLIETFYRAFQRRDWAAMQGCYHDQVDFSDPVFVNLVGSQAKAMWHMLLANATELEVTFSNIQADQERGSCRWEATYLFSQTGRRVHNKIRASFRFSDNKIILHRDEFDLWKWSQMALGFSGTLFGWSSYGKGKIREKALQNLYRFIEKNPQYK
ncbi:MAG: nuclear transport factor 2 family protein [Cyclobacteriaceae bacterium]